MPSRKIPFETTILVRDTCLCLHTHRAARALARRFDDVFRPLGITHGQFSLMMFLNQPQSPTLGAIASLLEVDRTTLTANLKPLERDGYVKSSVDPRDRRIRRVSLTARGEDLLARATPLWVDTHRSVERDAGGADMDGLRRGLAAVRTGIAGPIRETE